jgi:hypothetical protein
MMTEISAASIVALFETNKEQRKSFVEQIVQQAMSGNQDMLKLHKQVKAMEEIVKKVLEDEDYRNILIDEAAKHGKSFKYLGDDWTIKETGVKYNYTDCNDPLLDDLLKEQADIAEKVEKRKDFLKSLDRSMDVIIEDTGEIARVYPPVKSSTTVVSLKMS